MIVDILLYIFPKFDTFFNFINFLFEKIKLIHKSNILLTNTQEGIFFKKHFVSNIYTLIACGLLVCNSNSKIYKNFFPSCTTFQVILEQPIDSVLV